MLAGLAALRRQVTMLIALVHGTPFQIQSLRTVMTVRIQRLLVPRVFREPKATMEIFYLSPCRSLLVKALSSFSKEETVAGVPMGAREAQDKTAERAATAGGARTGLMEGRAEPVRRGDDLETAERAA